MADPLREKLKALVEEWESKWTARDGWSIYPDTCTRQLAALLAESEGEPCRHGKDCVECEQEREPAQDEHIHTAGWGGEPCVICGEPVGCPDCEAKAKLPLGHPFVPFDDEGESDGTCQSMRCGKSRSAHEPK